MIGYALMPLVLIATLGAATLAALLGALWGLWASAAVLRAVSRLVARVDAVRILPAGSVSGKKR